MMAIDQIKHSFQKEISSAPLVFFRIAFGTMMFLSLLRFWAMDWIDTLYIQPKFYFAFYGFEWIKPFSGNGMYFVFGAMLLATLFIATGLFYRIACITFFLLFTYVELIDKTNYLNHYYFISIISFLFCLLPTTGSIFAYNKNKSVPRWAILTLQLQMGIVYFFAGIAKINPDWLLNAMPLKIWLATKTDLPIIGNLLSENWVAYVFSWCGMLFDVSIAFFLFNRKTVWYAYAIVVVFHVVTAILFPGIGMFPFVMIVCATVFLPSNFHEQVLRILKVRSRKSDLNPTLQSESITNVSVLLTPILLIHFLIQILLPLRSHLYPKNLFYHEQGYRFSWRVMLMEKAGTVFFTVKNKQGKLVEVDNRNFLTMQQEKQMSTQPDMILQFAHYLKEVYSTNEVYAEAYVTVNGNGSQLFIDPKQNLCEVNDNFQNKNWVIAAK
jgi:hypothetical protein